MPFDLRTSDISEVKGEHGKPTLKWEEVGGYESSLTGTLVSEAECKDTLRNSIRARPAKVYFSETFFRHRITPHSEGAHRAVRTSASFSPSFTQLLQVWMAL